MCGTKKCQRRVLVGKKEVLGNGLDNSDHHYCHGCYCLSHGSKEQSKYSNTRRLYLELVFPCVMKDIYLPCHLIFLTYISCSVCYGLLLVIGKYTGLTCTFDYLNK